MLKGDTPTLISRVKDRVTDIRGTKASNSSQVPAAAASQVSDITIGMVLMKLYNNVANCVGKLQRRKKARIEQAGLKAGSLKVAKDGGEGRAGLPRGMKPEAIRAQKKFNKLNGTDQIPVRTAGHGAGAGERGGPYAKGREMVENSVANTVESAEAHCEVEGDTADLDACNSEEFFSDMCAVLENMDVLDGHVLPRNAAIDQFCRFFRGSFSRFANKLRGASPFDTLVPAPNTPRHRPDRQDRGIPLRQAGRLHVAERAPGTRGEERSRRSWGAVRSNSTSKR